MNKPAFTLTGGPVGVTERVLHALGSQILYDDDDVFRQRFRDTQTKVAQVFGTSADVVLMQGEAVLGLEAAALSLITSDTTCLNLVSGVYAQWYGELLRRLGATVIEHTVPFNSSVDPADVEAILRANPAISVVAVVHCETPSGTLNPIREIGQLAQEYDALVICDAVASLGGVEVDPDTWGLDICVSAPQKCLGGAPGLSLASVSDAAWAAMRRNPSAPRSSYLSLLDWKDIWEENGRFPYTPAVSEVTGLEAACDEILDDGVALAIARHQIAARACRAGIHAAGLEIWPATDEIAAPCVTAVTLPRDIDEAVLRRLIRDRYGVVISGGEGELVGRLVRIGHMGLTSQSLYPVLGVMALTRGLADLGVKLDIGAAVTSALAEVAAGSATDPRVADAWPA